LYLQGIQQKSKKRGWDSWITFGEYQNLIHQPCTYCGDIDSNVMRDRLRIKVPISGTVVRYNGIDRIDSSKGYVTGNVVPCCKRCNIAKNDMTFDEWREWSQRLADNFVYSKFSSRAGIRIG
jgi:5-methylcytosine-specific restriction endonuclease McrA